MRRPADEAITSDSSTLEPRRGISPSQRGTILHPVRLGLAGHFQYSELGARPAPAGKSEHAQRSRAEERALAGLRNYAKAHGRGLKGWIEIEPERRGEAVRAEVERPTAPPAARTGAEDCLVPLPDIAALVERAVRARRA